MKSIPDMEQCIDVAHLLKTLAHPQRLMIMCQLADGPKSVGELEELSGATQSAVSQFLARMKAQGLVVADREGHYVIYQVADPRIKKLLQSMYRIFCD